MGFGMSEVGQLYQQLRSLEGPDYDWNVAARRESESEQQGESMATATGYEVDETLAWVSRTPFGVNVSENQPYDGGFDVPPEDEQHGTDPGNTGPQVADAFWGNAFDEDDEDEDDAPSGG